MTLHAEKARILMECLPYIRQFKGEVVVIKYGGHAMVDDVLKQSFALNVALLKYIGVNPIIVHGGGPQIGEMLKKLNIQSTFREGLRVTDDATMDVVEMVLAGKVNKEIVSLLNSAGVKAIGLCGKDGHFLQARRLEMVVEGQNTPPEIINLGHVGEVMRVDTSILQTMTMGGFIPVIAPIGVDNNNESYNINADSVAGAIAAALKAKRLLLLTDVAGILNKEKELIRSLNMNDAWELFANGTLQGGMIPKVKCCLEALQEGVEKAMIVDGRVENSILLELFTDSGIGTEITQRKKPVERNQEFLPPLCELTGNIC